MTPSRKPLKAQQAPSSKKPKNFDLFTSNHAKMSSSASSFRQIIGVPPSTASPKDSALIIIDAQNEYAAGKLKVSNVETSRKAITSLLQKYRDANGQVVHVVHETPDGAPVFTPGTDLAKEFEELTPKGNEKVVRKNYPSSFAETDLQQHLESIGIKKIVLVGYMVRRPAHLTTNPALNSAGRHTFASQLRLEMAHDLGMMWLLPRMLLGIGTFLAWTPSS